MASRTLPGIALEGFWAIGEDGWNTGADSNWRKLSVITQLSVKSQTTALPGSPVNGDIYIVPSGAALNANRIAVRDNGAWVYFTASEGWRAWVQDTNIEMVFDGAVWNDVSSKNFTLSLFSSGTMLADEVLFVYVATGALLIPAGATGSAATSEVAATASTTLSVFKIASGVTTTVGTVEFAAGAAVGTFTVASNISLAAGDRIGIKAPAVADVTLADVSISLKGSIL